jgi:hypothetical protein
VRKSHGENGAGYMENMWAKKHRAKGDEIEKHELNLAISDEPG